MDLMTLFQVGLGFGLHFFGGFISALRKGEKFDQGKLLATTLWGISTILVLAVGAQDLIKDISSIDLGSLVATTGGVGVSALAAKFQPMLAFAFDFLVKNLVRVGK